MSISEKLYQGVAIVTGAGSGLGRALSLELAGRGLTVVGLGRRKALLDEVADLAPGQRFHAFHGDVSDAEAVRQIIDQVHARFAAPSILINNAAIYPHRDILDETPQSFSETMDINFGGCLNCCHAVLPHMVSQGYGRIINVGSFADINPAPVSAAYSVSKGAARILTRSLVADLNDRFPDIILNDWMPGVLNTSMGLATGIAPEQSAVWGVNLALSHARDLNGVTFECDQEVMPVLSLKRRVFNKISGRGARARSVSKGCL